MAKILALIPARGGSKRIPRKNVLPLAGHPLLSFSVAAGRLAASVDRVIVSTDDPEVARIANAYGAETPFLRPAEISGDSAVDLDCFRHALETLEREEGYAPDLVVHLRPTTPLRDARLIDRAVALIQADPRATSLRSGHLNESSAYKLFREKGSYCEFFGKEDFEPGFEFQNLPQQALPPTYNANGYVDIVLPRTIRETGTLHGPRIKAFVTEKTADIDGLADVTYCQSLLAREDYAPLLEKVNELAARRPPGAAPRP